MRALTLRRHDMGLLGLIVFGAILGFLADAIDRKHDNSWIANVLLGITGAVGGGLLRQLLTDTGPELTWDLQSFLWGLLGTLAVLFLYHTIRPKIDRNRNV